MIAKKLLLMPENELFKKMLTVSFAVHVSIFLIMGLKALFFPHEAMNFDSAVKVDLVDLPDKIKNLPPPSTPAALTTPAVPTTKTPPAPAEVKPKEEAISLKKRKATALDRIKQFEKEEKKNKSIEKIQAELKHQEALERAEKLKSLLVKGNAISPGTALHGVTKSEFNEYIGQIHSQIQEHWNLPEWLSNANLKATVAVFIDNKGSVVKKIVEQSSGDSRFDGYALKAVDDSSPFPPPPDKFRDLVKVDGIRFRFPQ